MTPYPYDTMTMNGREITIQNIVNWISRCGIGL